MFFLFILLIIILMIFTLSIKIDVVNFFFTTQIKSSLNKTYEICITLYVFGKVPLFKFNLNRKNVRRILKNKRIKKMMNKQQMKILENKKDICKQILEGLKSVKIDLEKMNLRISIGTENASITALIIPIISTFLSIFLSNKVKKYNDKQIFSIIPVYINKNLINIEFSGILEIRLINILSLIYKVNNKKIISKYGNEADRESYDYGYE